MPSTGALSHIPDEREDDDAGDAMSTSSQDASDSDKENNVDWSQFPRAYLEAQLRNAQDRHQALRALRGSAGILEERWIKRTNACVAKRQNYFQQLRSINNVVCRKMAVMRLLIRIHGTRARRMRRYNDLVADCYRLSHRFRRVADGPFPLVCCLAEAEATRRKDGWVFFRIHYDILKREAEQKIKEITACLQRDAGNRDGLGDEQSAPTTTITHSADIVAAHENEMVNPRLLSQEIFEMEVTPEDLQQLAAELETVRRELEELRQMLEDRRRDLEEERHAIAERRSWVAGAVDVTAHEAVVASPARRNQTHIECEFTPEGYQRLILTVRAFRHEQEELRREQQDLRREQQEVTREWEELYREVVELRDNQIGPWRR